MKIRYGILARQQLISGDNRIPSIIGIMEELTFKGSAIQEGEFLMLPFVGVFTLLLDAESERDRIEHQVGRFWFETPAGLALELPVEIYLQGKPRGRVVIGIDTFPLAGPGAYSLKFQLGSVVSSWDLAVHVLARSSK